jgi:hypothetical protein
MVSKSIKILCIKRIEALKAGKELSKLPYSWGQIERQVQ